MCKKICIVGSPSCRKSTVSVTLESRLKQRGFNVDIAEEYARTYIQRYGVPFTPFQQFLIFEKQLRREQDIISTKADFLITDTAPWLGAIYCRLLVENALREDAERGITLREKAYTHCFNEIMKKSLENIKTYDHIFFFPVEHTAINDGTRTQTEDERIMIEESIKGMASIANVKYETITGTVEEKANQILEIILPKKLDHHPW